jgi:TonB family protein
MTGRRLGVTLTTGMLTLAILSVAASRALDAQGAPVQFPTRSTTSSIFNGTDLAGWKTEFTKADVRDGILHVGSGNGWVRTERAYADFVMTLDVRLESKGEAGIFVRAWPTFDSASTPNNGYRFRFSNPKAATDWMRVEVECAGSTLTVRVDGAVVHTADALQNPQGYVALWGTDQTAQFRAIEIRPRPRPRLDASPGVVVAGAAAISNPQPVGPRPTPRYTSDAMRARIAGTVTLAATVQPDGTVGDVRVLQSLDPRYGLDAAAVATAQSWRFTPGTRAGEPVPVRVLIEFDFNLR